MTGPQTKLLLLSEIDNVYVALAALSIGPEIASDGSMVDVTTPVVLGHKIARRQISPGEKILKYGVPIGSAVTEIARGEHVHVQNIKSDYTPTHLLEETAGGTKNA